MGKAFNSLDHNFLISTLEKYGFAKNFNSWVKINKEISSRVFLIGVQLRSIFCLGEAPVRVTQFRFFLFILALEILFHLIQSKREIKGLTIFDHCYLYSAYADDAIVFLQDTISIKHMYFFKIRLNKIWNCGYWSPERGSSGSLCYALCKSK